MAVDRYGSRRLAIPGLILSCAAVAGLSLAGGEVATWWLGWMILALVSLPIKPAVWIACVVRHFAASRGLALGLALCGGGLASATLPFLTTLLLENYGWRGTYTCLALGCLAISLPFTWFGFVDQQESLAPVETQAARRAPAAGGLSAREIFKSRQFYQMALAAFLISAASTALIVHFVPILREGGSNPRDAAAIAGAIGITTIIGRLATGWMLDRFNPYVIAFFAFATPVLSCLALLVHGGTAFAVTAALILGLAGGAEFDAVGYLSTRLFGKERFGMSFGTIAGLMALGIGVGPFLAGASFDHSGSYSTTLIIACPTFLLGGLLMITLGGSGDEAASARGG